MKNTVKQIKGREILVQIFLLKWKKIAQVLLDLALGKTKIVEIEGKKVKVYEREPNVEALRLIIEIVIGKPKQEILFHLTSPQLDELNKVMRMLAEQRKKESQNAG